MHPGSTVGGCHTSDRDADDSQDQGLGYGRYLSDINEAGKKSKSTEVKAYEVDSLVSNMLFVYNYKKRQKRWGVNPQFI